jgi:hypothetical protein
MYRLKKGIEAFSVVEGPMAGRAFAAGKTYEEIPPQEAEKFEEIKEATDPAGKAPRVKNEKAAAASSENSEVK